MLAVPRRATAWDQGSGRLTFGNGGEALAKSSVSPAEQVALRAQA